jgi:mannose-6-phosphate isomerase class I
MLVKPSNFNGFEVAIDRLSLWAAGIRNLTILGGQSMSLSEPWQVEDELIEQPSWGGRYIIDLKGLSQDSKWAGKKVGQSYELAGTSKLIDPQTGKATLFTDLVKSDAAAWLGKAVVNKYTANISLLIKLTQAKGNSFQVHLPEGKTLKHWLPKPEAWFYLAPGLFTFGLKPGTSFDAYSNVLRTIDDHMHRLSDEVLAGKRTVEDARQQASSRIAALNPMSYINIVHAQTDDIVDLTAGGIHHSWEEDNVNYPEGNLVYEVQVDVQDEFCSMRGFDKGKILDDGKLRATHVDDYLATIEQDSYHNDLSQHVRKPGVVSSGANWKIESLFRTPYFDLDRINAGENSLVEQSTADGFHHLFVHSGCAKIGSHELKQGSSYIVPAAIGNYEIKTTNPAVILKTYLPV